MLASDPAGIVGKGPTDGNVEEQFPDESMMIAERAIPQITQAGRHLAVRNRDWTPEALGEAVYMYTLWVLRRKGGGCDSMGSKLNRRSPVEAELEIHMGDK